jgi:hypothetical protein
VARAAQSVGGRLEQFYFAFGDHDAVAVADLPDNTSAAAFALAVSEAGGATVRTVVLLTPEEVDAATKHAVEYQPQWNGRSRATSRIRPAGRGYERVSAARSPTPSGGHVLGRLS